jgi:hypothetical protein
VTLDDVLGDTATITVTPAAQAVQAAPAFTG